jgi:penicillin-binding protein 1A
LEERFPEARRVVSPEIAYMMTNLMEGVIQNGTGRRARTLGRPAAGKTGTTNDFRDAWFFGYTPEIIAGVWVGMDDRTTLGQGEAGGRAATPIWLEFMQEAVRGYPLTDFAIPAGVRFVRIVAENGEPATYSTTAETLFEVFLDGTHPVSEPQLVPDFRRNMRVLDRVRRPAAPAPSG